MEIKLNKEEKVNLKYSECPMCHKSFNAGKRTKTSHHILPLLLKPLTDVKIDLCLECHEKLNKLTGHKEIASTMNLSNSFKEFKSNYEHLREEFFSKRINRGQFGEGLWNNLVSFLESKEKDEI